MQGGKRKYFYSLIHSVSTKYSTKCASYCRFNIYHTFPWCQKASLYKTFSSVFFLTHIIWLSIQPMCNRKLHTFQNLLFAVVEYLAAVCFGNCFPHYSELNQQKVLFLFCFENYYRRVSGWVSNCHSLCHLWLFLLMVSQQSIFWQWK